MKLVLLILILNTMTAFLYLFWGLYIRKRKRREESRLKYVLLSFVMLICPLTGPVFLGLSHLLLLLLPGKRAKLAGLSFKRKKSKIYTPADVERDINIAPMQEVLVISDVQRRRKLLLDIAKKDIRRSLGSIAIALNNPDSETSHYAASVIMDALSEFRANVQNMTAKFKEDPEDFSLGSLLLNYIHQVHEQDILNDDEQKTYVYLEDEIGDILFAHHREKLEAQQYRILTEDLVDAGDYPLAEKWSHRAKKYRDHQLDTYLCCLKLYFSYNDREAFLECLDQLKCSGIVVNRETMELIRLFQGQEE